jgi:uncharacterized protein (TIGR02246 family)
MVWKRILLIAVVAAVALTSLATQSQQPPRTDQKKPAAKATKNAEARAKDADPRDGEIAALEKSAQAFAEAFNKRDAKAVAALWTKDGEYIDDSGRHIEGRDAIEKEYASFFAAHSDAMVTVVVDSLRLASDTTAIEDGRAVVQLGPVRPGAYGQYTAVHVKSDGKWLMSSVRDVRVATSPAADRLQDLGWLVGSWSVEEMGANLEVTCRWIADGSFLERAFSVKRGDQVVDSGKQIIGWNPQAQQIQSWTFASDGGLAVGVWNPLPEGWAIETTGMLPDGTPTRAVNLFTRLDNNACTWQSVERSAGDVALADTEEVLIKRSQPNSK